MSSSSLVTSHGQDGGDVEVLREVLDGTLLLVAEIGERERAALARERLCDRVGQTPLVGNSQNEGKFALQQFGHELTSLSDRAAESESNRGQDRGREQRNDDAVAEISWPVIESDQIARDGVAVFRRAARFERKVPRTG